MNSQRVGAVVDQQSRRRIGWASRPCGCQLGVIDGRRRTRPRSRPDVVMNTCPAMEAPPRPRTDVLGPLRRVRQKSAKQPAPSYESAAPGDHALRVSDFGDPASRLGPARRTPAKENGHRCGLATAAAGRRLREPATLAGRLGYQTSRHATAAPEAAPPSAGVFLPSRTATVVANTTIPTKRRSSPRGSSMFHLAAVSVSAGSATMASTKVIMVGAKAQKAISRPAPATNRSTERNRHA